MGALGRSRSLFRGWTPRLHDERGRLVAPERLREEAGRLRAWLLSDPRRRPVALSLERGWRHPLAILACLEAGVPFVLVAPAWPPRRREELRALTGFTRVVDERLWAALPPSRGRTRPWRPEAGEMLYSVCTSGSTGRPKALCVSRGAFERFLDGLGRLARFVRPGARHLATCEPAFDMTLIDLGLALTRDASLFSSRFSRDFFELAWELETWRIEGLVTLPENLACLLREEVRSRADLSRLGYALVGGAAWPPELAAGAFSFLSGGFRLFNIYGPCEAVVFTHAHELRGVPALDERQGLPSIGRPFPGVVCRLEDARGRQVRSALTRGVLLLGGPQLMTGYMRRGRAGARGLVRRAGRRFYKTGDLAFFDEKGRWYIAGRAGETLKRRGYRVNLADIEASVRALDGVKACAMLAYPDPDRGCVLVCCVEARRGAAAARLSRELALRLPDYQRPDKLVIVARLPRGATGKVDKPALYRRWKSAEEVA